MGMIRKTPTTIRAMPSFLLSPGVGPKSKEPAVMEFAFTQGSELERTTIVTRLRS